MSRSLRVRAEEELRAHLAAIVESSDDAIVSKDLNGIITTWNASAERLYGYTAEEAIGQPISMLTPADQADELLAIMDRLRAGERVDHYDTIHEAKDGRRLSISLRISPIRDSRGEIVGASAVGRDITDRKRAEQALAKELVDHKRLQEISCRLIPTDDVHTLYTQLLDSAIDIMQADRGTMQVLDGETGELCLLDARGMPKEVWEKFARVSPDARTSCAEALRRGERVIVDYLTDEPFAGTADARAHLDAEIRAAQSTPLLTRAGLLVGMLSTHWSQPPRLAERQLYLLDILARQAADLMDRARAEEALRESEQRLRLSSEQFETLLNQAPLGVYSVDSDFRIRQVNPPARTVFTDFPGGVIGRDFKEILHAMWTYERAEEIVRIFRRTLETGEPFHAAEFAEVRADRGVTEYYDWRTERIVLPEGRYGVVCYFRDISEQVNARLAVAESERRYRTLFESIDEGFCVVQMIYDDANKPFDCRFIEVNPAFETQAGLKDAVGRTLRELVPSIEPRWFETFGQVARTGEPIRFVDFSMSLGRWFDIDALRIGEPEQQRVAVLFTDITNRKQAEQKLRESEERLRLAKAAARIGIYDYDVATGTSVWDERTRAIWGVGDDEPVSYDLWLSSLHPDDRETTQAAFQAALDPNGDGIDCAEYRIINRNDGMTRWVHVTGRATFCDGNPMRLVGTAQDITERKAAEEQLRRNHETFFKLIQNSPFGVYIIDSQFQLRQVSAGAQKVFQNVRPLILRDLAEVLRGIWEEPFASEAIARFRHTLETGEPFVARDTTEKRHDISEVESYDWRIERITLPDGQFGVVCYFYDLSDIKRAEAEIRQRVGEAEEARRILQGIMEHVPEGITVADAPDVSIRMVSRHGLELVGRPPESLIGTPDSVHPETWGIFHADGKTLAGSEELPLTRAVRHGENVMNEEWLLRRSDGSHIPVLCSAGPIRDSQGTVVGGIIAWRDITERKRTEEALKLADRRKDEFLATLAHELRNPLAAIRIAIDVMGNSTDDPVQVSDMMAIIERQSSQLVRLIDDLLDVSRISRGTIALKRTAVDIAEVVAHVVESSRAFCEDKELDLSAALPEHPIVVDADPVRFAQVVTNLLHNACKFTQRGGRIRVSVERAGEDAVVRVADTGIGMPPEQLPRIFDMFAQVDEPGSNKAGGLGIGLSLARSILDLHGGTIEAKSDGPDTGSEFLVRIRALEGDAPQATTVRRHGPRIQPQRSATVQRIVAADDNADALDAVAQMLRMRGHEVQTAADGAEAFEMVRMHRPDIALLDIGMPGIDGYEVARRIRQEPWGREMLLVAMTGWGQQRDKQQAEEAGFDTHLTKPVDLEILERVLAARPTEAPAPAGAADGPAR
jgi:PAS domain S-box-containing protein